MRSAIILCLALTTLGTLGCNHRTIGHFGDGAFYHARGHYRIRYAGAADQLLDPRWRLTNYNHDDAGHPTNANLRIHGVDVVNTAWLNGGGRGHDIQVPKVDLHYRDDTGRSEIWVRSMVMPNAWDQTPTASILHTWVSAIRDPRIPLAPLGRRFQPSSIALRNYGQARVDGRTAHWVELDIARGQVEQRVTLVGVRPGERRWQWRRRRSFPMMLVFGVSSPPEDHDTARRDFERLVRRVDIPR